jgi:hypothetical protein
MNLLRLLLASSTLALLSACTAPVAAPPLVDPAPTGKPGLTARWSTTSELRLVNLVATSAGEEGAVAYFEWDRGDESNNPRSRVLLQRLDASGIARGAPVEITGMLSPAPEQLTLTNDGARYLACWDQAAQIACATVPLGEGVASSAVTLAVGSSPAVAHGPGGFALAYSLPGQVAAVHVGSDGAAAGKPVTIATVGDVESRVLLASTKLGFALVRGATSGSGATMHVHSLDSAFAPVDDPIDLGAPFWTRAALTTTDTTVAVSVAKPYAGQIFLLEGGDVAHTHELEGGYKEGLNVALAADGAAIGALSADDRAGIRYTRMEGDELTTPADVEEADLGRFDDGSLAALRLHGDMFVAASNGAPGGEIIIARAQRP